MHVEPDPRGLLAGGRADHHQRVTVRYSRRKNLETDLAAGARSIVDHENLSEAFGQPACEDDIKAETSATPRCIPAGGPPEQGLCVRCNLPSAYGKRLIFGRAY